MKEVSVGEWVGLVWVCVKGVDASPGRTSDLPVLENRSVRVDGWVEIM